MVHNSGPKWQLQHCVLRHPIWLESWGRTGSTESVRGARFDIALWVLLPGPCRVQHRKTQFGPIWPNLALAACSIGKPNLGRRPAAFGTGPGRPTATTCVNKTQTCSEQSKMQSAREYAALFKKIRI
eukprot:80263-Chlamydomonas_euryale.AAC.3